MFKEGAGDDCSGEDIALLLIGLGQARYQGDYVVKIIRALLEKVGEIKTPTISRLATAMNRFDAPDDLIVLMHRLIQLSTSKVGEYLFYKHYCHPFYTNYQCFCYYFVL